MTSLVADVAPRTGKIIKNDPVLFKKEKICYKMVSTLSIYIKLIVRYRVSKLEFTRMKN